MIEIITKLSEYRAWILTGVEICLLVILCTIFSSLYRKWKEDNRERKENGDNYQLKIDYKGTVDNVERQNAIRKMLAPDGVDPSPNSYMCLSDGGKEYYIRMVTISRLPKKLVFGESLKKMMEFPNCTSTVFAKPIDNDTMSRTIDRHINVLETEEILSEGKTNRIRKLGAQKRKVRKWADQVDEDDKKFFFVGFLFEFIAESVEELNRITDDFRILAMSKKMDISNCYGVQSEAFLANLPLNRQGNKKFLKGNSDCIKMFRMDQEALSVVLNYTSGHFSHKNGIPLGRNLFTGLPFIHDIYDPSHDGFTIVIAGKTNSGKSATIKMMIERDVPRGYRFVIIDSQARKGTSEGEYAAVTESNGGVNYQISSRQDNILNLFDLQEMVEYVKETAWSGYERRTLDLNSAVTDIVYNLSTLIRGNMQSKTPGENINLDTILNSDINDILTRITKELFAERGIVHGDADSLYEKGSVVQDGKLQSGMVRKELPTLTDFFKKLIIERANMKNSGLANAYRMIESNLRENVRELYYTESGKFFTKDEFEKLDVNPKKTGEKMYHGEPVIELHGIRPYYDGQSSFSISRDCPITTIDISQLPEIERRSARNISLHLVDGGFVQKNSERLGSADRLVVIIDESHESFVDPGARYILSNETRTARKRNTGIIYATQTVEEFDRYPETKDILSQAAVKMIFKQDVNDRQRFIELLKITESQADFIINRLGVVSDTDDPSEAARHKGEVCVIDGGQTTFVKVDYLKRTEAFSVETDVSSIIKARRIG